MSVANERMSERVRLQLRDIHSFFMLTCGSHSLKWQTTHFSFSAAVLCSIGWSGKLADYSIVSAFTKLIKSLSGWSLVANALLLGSPWG